MKPLAPAARHAEALEARRMFAVVGLVGAGTLYVYGDDGPADGIALDSTSTHIVLKAYSSAAGKYVQVQQFAKANVSAIRI
jgi:hypothetical protein